MSRYEVNVAVTLWVEADDEAEARAEALADIEDAFDHYNVGEDYWFTVAEQAYLAPPEERDDSHVWAGNGARDDGWYTTDDLANAAGPDDGWSD